MGNSKQQNYVTNKKNRGNKNFRKLVINDIRVFIDRMGQIDLCGA